MNDKKFIKNFREVINTIIEYCGEENRREIEQRAKSVKIKVVGKNDKRYEQVKEEPICIKRPKYNCVLISKDTLVHPSANNMIVHRLVQALGEESFVLDDKDFFNETIVDYIANEVCKKLEEKDINLSYNDNPDYDSKSVYSKYYGVVENFLSKNKQGIIKARLTPGYKLSDKMKDVITRMQEKVDITSKVSNASMGKR